MFRKLRVLIFNTFPPFPPFFPAATASNNARERENPGGGFQRAFREIVEAYETLTDAQSRK